MKKILFVHTKEFKYISGSSIYFSTLFKNINYEIIDIACFGNANTINICHNQYVLFNSLNKFIIKILNNSFLGFIYKFYLYNLWIFKASRKVEKLVDLKAIDKIWVLSSGCSIPLVKLLSEKHNIPIHVTIHDDVGGIYLSDRCLLKNKMSLLLQNAESRDFVSETMLKILYAKYRFCKKNNYVIYPIPNLTIQQKPHISKELKTIAFTGNIWAIDAFVAFCKAIHIFNEKREEKNKVKFVVYADDISLYLNKYKNLSDIVFEKVLPLDDLMAKLRTYDLLYVPMTFKLNQKKLCETSLPSKIFPYTYSQIPIFAHGPEWASNIKFVQKHKIGFCSNTTNPKQIADELNQIEASFLKRKSISENQFYLSENQFSVCSRNEKLNKIFK